MSESTIHTLRNADASEWPMSSNLSAITLAVATLTTLAKAGCELPGGVRKAAHTSFVLRESGDCLDNLGHSSRNGWNIAVSLAAARARKIDQRNHDVGQVIRKAYGVQLSVDLVSNVMKLGVAQLRDYGLPVAHGERHILDFGHASANHAVVTPIPGVAP